MTDWDRVERLRQKGRSWTEVAGDSRVGFRADAGTGTDPGRALKVLYFRRRSASQSDPKRRRADRSPRSGRHPRFSRRMTSLVTLAILAAFLGSVLWFLVLSPNAPPPPGATHASLDSYCGGLPEDVHYHPLLVIMDNGAQQPLPSTLIGIGPGCEHALHTHDGSGIIHVEMNDEFTVTPNLADFFAIWGEPLSPGNVWTFSGSMTATMWDMGTHSAASYSSDPGSIPLYRPSGGPTSNPYPIPQGWIFNGEYGDGASGGTFDGEVIWLNVTSSGAATAATICSEPSGVCCLRCSPALGSEKGSGLRPGSNGGTHWGGLASSLANGIPPVNTREHTFALASIQEQATKDCVDCRRPSRPSK